MKTRTLIFSAILSFAAALPLLSQAAPTATSAPAKPASAAAPGNQNPRDGQKVFEQNCQRCHEAPQGFSTRISGTVSHHMQARANLSKADLDALLRFFNP